MAAIYFTLLMILGFLAIPAEPRTFPGDQRAVVIIYERSSSSSSLQLDLSAIISAISHHEENNIDEVEAPIPRPSPPSPTPASPISEFTSMAPAEGCDDTNGDGCLSMVTAGKVPPKKPAPPAPKPATPTQPIM
ncbi:unnamed protein product [Linum tenue]|uniref:Uncharacterized protein n=1 Tax=Linum tenue TaxID=586396 RepID=A0AAV0KFY1_9ROSI|nr:unnamed protein product [Linum tenue]